MVYYIFNEVFINLKEGSGHDDVDSNTLEEKNYNSVDDSYEGDDGNKKEPKPEKNIDLLIDDVESQNTKTIMDIDCSRRAIFVKSTFSNLHANRKIYTKRSNQ